MAVAVPSVSRVGEVSMSLAWRPPQQLPLAQELHVRSVPASWAQSRVISLSASATSVEVDGLLPTSSYEFRLQYTTTEGATLVGQGFAADTLPAGCGGESKQSKGACTLQ